MENIAKTMYYNELCHNLVIGPSQLVKNVVQVSTATQFNILCKVTGKKLNRGSGYALQIPVICTCIGLKKAVAWIQ